MTDASFKNRFRFSESNHLKVGLERECFLTRQGNIMPIAKEVLRVLPEDGRFGYELSACQLEERVGPFDKNAIVDHLLENEQIISEAKNRVSFERLFLDVAPETMPLDVYPDPTGRYASISQNLPRHILVAACRVAAVHVHIGMESAETALMVYNEVIENFESLCEINSSDSQRLEIYKVMAPDFKPCPYKDWEEFEVVAKEKGFCEDPRQCWNLIRISQCGTIEFRMFDTTDNLNKIQKWIEKCHQLCADSVPKKLAC